MPLLRLPCGLLFEHLLPSLCLGLFIPDITDNVFIRTYVELHNRLRSNVTPQASNMRYLAWDSSLAKSAKSWAEECKFTLAKRCREKGMCHPTLSQVGQNIWIGTTSVPVVDQWFKQGEYYDHDKGTCTNICTYYTQVVWAESYKVGCAVHSCAILSGYPRIFTVCNYAPGAVQGERPFELGEPCSGCPEDECVDNLCHGNWTPPWDPHFGVSRRTSSWDGSSLPILPPNYCFVSLFVIHSFFSCCCCF
ncbi:GLIPR1-like protein 1 isoform X2 [Lissotriton helveticus]